MEAFAYSNSPWPIRPELPEAFRYTWETHKVGQRKSIFGRIAHYAATA